VRLWRLAKCEIAFLVATLRGSRCCFLPSVRHWSESFSWRALWNCRRNFHPFSQRETLIRVSLGSSTEIPKYDQQVPEFCTPYANLAMNVTPKSMTPHLQPRQRFGPSSRLLATSSTPRAAGYTCTMSQTGKCGTLLTGISASSCTRPR
jgi:hypothetical protein